MLSKSDITTILMVDEIHLKPYLDYKAGTIVGNAYNEDSDKLAKTAQVFMLGSLLSNYKEVVHILPVNTIKAEELHYFIKKIIVKLECIGFKIIAVVTDNNAINRKSMSLFSDPPEWKNEYEHPVNLQRPLFYLTDSVHLLKNIRNNWVNDKLQKFNFPNFENYQLMRIACFQDLKAIHRKEQNELLKYGYTLSLKALYPSSMERQNVKLVLQVFNQHTVSAIKALGPQLLLENSYDTANFIEIICRWWDIANVKTPLKGKRLLNKFQEPVTKNSIHIIEFLEKFIQWVNKWNESDSVGKLTKETGRALCITSEGFLKLLKYLLDKEGFNYVLLGKIQTDQLEERFGKYRYQAGSQYLVSVRQIFEAEAKLRIMSVASLILKSNNCENLEIEKKDLNAFLETPDENSICLLSYNHIPLELSNLCIAEEYDFNSIEPETWPNIVYIAGYASHKINRKLNCTICKPFLMTLTENFDYNSSLITENNRGGLCYPTDSVVTVSTFTYLSLTKILKKEHVFLQQKFQQKILVKLSINVISNLDLDLFSGHNCCLHSIDFIIINIINHISNILLKNYIKKKNDIKGKTSMPKLKRLKPNKN